MSTRSLVLGLGNLLISDEGFGVHAVQRLRERYEYPPDVELVDGGTLGLGLLPVLEDADRIIILDAVDLGQPPGTLVRLGWEDISRALQVKISPHQETAAEALAMLELTRGRPADFRIVGVQPVSLATGIELSPLVEEAVKVAILDVLEILATWGHAVTHREPDKLEAPRDPARMNESSTGRRASP